MNEVIGVINAGSSSLKFALFRADAAQKSALLRGEIEGIGRAINISTRDADGAPIVSRPLDGPATHDHALAVLIDLISQQSESLVIVGHRVVHGGAQFVAPVVLTPEIIASLEALEPLAPLHQPHNLAAIRALAKLNPELPQIACFDTAFHATQGPPATTFALPRALSNDGVRRYGFHGLSYEYIASVLPAYIGAAANGRTVVAHLGHGASMCAMVERRSVATTMGFSALDGLMMGTRCGAIDPGVILYLLQQKGLTAADISRLLYRESGLIGVSGLSDDMRDLLPSPSPYAAEAVALFVYRISRELGSLTAALGGLDALVFTGGVGENAPEIRARVCQQAAWLGVQVDEARNNGGEPRISALSSKVAVFALHTDEEAMIAKACQACAGSNLTTPHAQ